MQLNVTIKLLAFRVITCISKTHTLKTLETIHIGIAINHFKITNFTIIKNLNAHACSRRGSLFIYLYSLDTNNCGLKVTGPY